MHGGHMEKKKKWKGERRRQERSTITNARQGVVGTYLYGAGSV